MSRRPAANPFADPEVVAAEARVRDAQVADANLMLRELRRLSQLARARRWLAEAHYAQRRAQSEWGGAVSMRAREAARAREDETNAAEREARARVSRLELAHTRLKLVEHDERDRIFAERHAAENALNHLYAKIIDASRARRALADPELT